MEHGEHMAPAAKSVEVEHKQNLDNATALPQGMVDETAQL